MWWVGGLWWCDVVCWSVMWFDVVGCGGLVWVGDAV